MASRIASRTSDSTRPAVRRKSSRSTRSSAVCITQSSNSLAYSRSAASPRERTSPMILETLLSKDSSKATLRFRIRASLIASRDFSLLESTSITLQISFGLFCLHGRHQGANSCSFQLIAGAIYYQTCGRFSDDLDNAETVVLQCSPRFHQVHDAISQAHDRREFD